MMTKKKTSRFAGVKFVWTLPIVALLLFAFAEPEYRYDEVETTNNTSSTQEILSKKTVKMVGLVLDEEGEPIPGVSVVIKGTNNGRVSDRDGKFELEVPEAASIVMSFVGKGTIEDTYSGIITGYKKDEFFNRKYQMEDDVIGIGRADRLLPERKAPPPPPPPAPIKNGEKEVFYIVEDMPNFPGGPDAINNFVYELQDEAAKHKNIKGEAWVMFTVNVKGKVSDVKAVKSDNEKAAKEAVSIISSLPDWKPGKQRGKPVPVKYMMPVAFK
jgi:hypothetical protein